MAVPARFAVLAIAIMLLLPGCARPIVYRSYTYDTEAMRVLPNGKVKPIPPGQLKKQNRRGRGRSDVRTVVIDE